MNERRITNKEAKPDKRDATIARLTMGLEAVILACNSVAYSGPIEALALKALDYDK